MTAIYPGVHDWDLVVATWLKNRELRWAFKTHVLKKERKMRGKPDVDDEIFNKNS
jgi:hypothetical protein